MTIAYLVAKWLHIVSSTVLFGMGAGIAFFFIRAHRTGDTTVIAAVSRDVVIADALFTATAVVTQPLTGLAMLWISGASFLQPWLVVSIALYVLVGCFWLPVVRLQIRMRDMAKQAAATGTSLPDAYARCYKAWFALGWPAFLAVLVIFHLMVAKPAFPLPH
ncbi:MAG TPA: DUF2269 domain-containing protein [Casimicrobiaceae bacterium]|nr:DUF2269 domain-containing protein [Casimicrobiaceae bacterium]